MEPDEALPDESTSGVALSGEPSYVVMLPVDANSITLRADTNCILVPRV